MKVKAGCWHGGVPPFGYEIRNSKLSENKAESKWVKFIFKQALKGNSVASIKKDLDSNGVLARRGGLWTLGSIESLMTNTHYLGHYTYTDGVSDTPAASDNMFHPDHIVMGPGGSYSGGTIAISGTQYIYAEVTKRTGDPEYAEALDTSVANNVGVELFDALEPALADTLALVASNTAPDTYTPTSGKAAVCIAKVTNTSGTITVDDQYVVDNPTLFIPVPNVVQQVGS